MVFPVLEFCDVEILKGLKTFNYLFNERVFDSTFRILMIDTNIGNSTFEIKGW